MPLLKPNSSAAPGPVVLDLTDLGRQAERLREQVRQEADAVLAAAREQGAQRAEAAEAEARARGLEAGREEGFLAGQAEGQEQARAAGAEALAAATKLWEQAAAGVNGERQQLHEEAEGATLRLAVALARKVVARELHLHPEAVVDAVKDALAHVLDPVEVTVRLNPADLALLDELTPGLRSPAGKTVRLEADEAIDRGGCVVEHGAGEVDATLQRKLHRLASLLLGEEQAELDAGVADADLLDTDLADADLADADVAHAEAVDPDVALAAPGINPEAPPAEEAGEAAESVAPAQDASPLDPSAPESASAPVDDGAQP